MPQECSGDNVWEGRPSPPGLTPFLLHRWIDSLWSLWGSRLESPGVPDLQATAHHQPTMPGSCPGEQHEELLAAQATQRLLGWGAGQVGGWPGRHEKALHGPHKGACELGCPPGPVVRAHAKQTQLRQAGGRRVGQCLQTPPGFQVSDAQTSPHGLPSTPFLFSSLTAFLLPTMLVLSQHYQAPS